MISLYNLFETENQDGQYKIPMIDRNKEKRLNSKISRNTKYLFTDIPPEKRDLENLPRYANKKPKVRFQDWLEIDAKKLNSIILLQVGVGHRMVDVMGGVTELFMDLKLVILLHLIRVETQLERICY